MLVASWRRSAGPACHRKIVFYWPAKQLTTAHEIVKYSASTLQTVEYQYCVYRTYDLLVLYSDTTLYSDFLCGKLAINGSYRNIVE